MKHSTTTIVILIAACILTSCGNVKMQANNADSTNAVTTSVHATPVEGPVTDTAPMSDTNLAKTNEAAKTDAQQDGVKTLKKK